MTATDSLKAKNRCTIYRTLATSRPKKRPLRGLIYSTLKFMRLWQVYDKSCIVVLGFQAIGGGHTAGLIFSFLGLSPNENFKLTNP